MEHEMDVILGFMGYTCTYVIIKFTKWNTQSRVRMYLVLKTICRCNEVIFWIRYYSIMKDIITIINVYFMVLTHGNLSLIYVYPSIPTG